MSDPFEEWYSEHYGKLDGTMAAPLDTFKLMLADAFEAGGQAQAQADYGVLGSCESACDILREERDGLLHEVVMLRGHCEVYLDQAADYAQRLHKLENTENEEVRQLKRLIARMGPLIQHGGRRDCPMAFHRSSGEECTCGAIEVVRRAREIAREAGEKVDW